MTWDTLDNRQRARQLIRTLATLSRSDGDLAPTEEEFLLQVGKQHGLTLAELSAEITAAEAPEAFPTSEPDRMTILYYLVFLMKSDGDIAPGEAATIHHFGLKLGLREALVSDFVDLANAYRHGDIPGEEMLERIRVYLN